MNENRGFLQFAPRPICAVMEPLLPLLSLNKLDPDEAVQVREHIATCESCQSQLRDLDALRDTLRRHYDTAPTLEFMDDLDSRITLDDVMRTAALEAHPAPPALDMLEAWRLAPPPRLSMLGMLAAGLVIALLAVAILGTHGQQAKKDPYFRMPTPLPQLTISEFPIPTQQAGLVGITKGPDGNVWFVESGTITRAAIGRISPRGAITEFPIPTPHPGLQSITTGPNGTLWFTEDGKIGCITPTNGAITEFPLPASMSQGEDITTGPDGNLWFTAIAGHSNDGYIGRITPAGQVTTFPIPTSGSGGDPLGITVGPDGNLWFTMFVFDTRGVYEGLIGRITTQGTITEFRLPDAGSQPAGITVGPDGNLWFTNTAVGKVGRITVQGTISEFLVHQTDHSWDSITVGPDGNLWFTDGSGRIGRIKTGGVVTEFAAPISVQDAPDDIALGPDGHLWFTETLYSTLARIDALP